MCGSLGKLPYSHKGKIGISSSEMTAGFNTELQHPSE